MENEFNQQNVFGYRESSHQPLLATDEVGSEVKAEQTGSPNRREKVSRFNPNFSIHMARQNAPDIGVDTFNEHSRRNQRQATFIYNEGESLSNMASFDALLT